MKPFIWEGRMPTPPAEPAWYPACLLLHCPFKRDNGEGEKDEAGYDGGT